MTNKVIEVINGQSVQVMELEYKWYTLKELANKIYGVDRKTFRKRLEPFKEEIGKRIGYYYSVDQVKIIFARIPPPYRVIIKNDIINQT